MQIVEISDLITACDPVSGERLPVRRSGVLERLRAAGDRRAERIAARLPHHGDVLDSAAVDRELVAVHTELQRLSEELRMGDRVAELLLPLLAAVKATGGGPLRIVDVGCGLGYTIRWLAATGVLGPEVELVGADLNGALVTEARRLAEAEGLACRFLHADAFALGLDATVWISSGVLHHLRGDDLAAFLRAQDRPGTAAFCHFDIAATALAPWGARVFHRARMRSPLGRHDGVASARRAHPDPTLLAAAAATSLVPLLYQPVRNVNPFCATVRPVLGLRPELVAPFRAAMGRRARHLVAG